MAFLLEIQTRWYQLFAAYIRILFGKWATHDFIILDITYPHGSDSRACLYIRQTKWHDDYSENGNCCFLCRIHFEDICAI